jgi:hypothetical protein
MELDGFSFVENRRPVRDNPVLVRRARLQEQIDVQLSRLAVEDSSVTREDSPDEGPSGPQGRAAWWWVDESGGYLLAIKYARRPLELAKGKFAIKCGSLDDVRAALVAVRAEVAKGELDAQLAKLAGEVRSGFVKPTPQPKGKQPG